MEGCQESAQTCSLDDSLTSRQLQMRGCVVLMDMNQYWAFPCPWCHQTLLHLEKMTMSRWHSALPIYIYIYISSHNISRITHLFSPKILHLKDTCLDVSLTSSAATNSTACCCSMFSICMDCARILLRTSRLRLSQYPCYTRFQGDIFYT